MVLGGIIHANLSRHFGDVEESEHANLAFLYAGVDSSFEEIDHVSSWRLRLSKQTPSSHSFGRSNYKYLLLYFLLRVF